MRGVPLALVLLVEIFGAPFSTALFLKGRPSLLATRDTLDLLGPIWGFTKFLRFFLSSSNSETISASEKMCGLFYIIFVLAPQTLSVDNGILIKVLLLGGTERGTVRNGLFIC